MYGPKFQRGQKVTFERRPDVEWTVKNYHGTTHKAYSLENERPDHTIDLQFAFEEEMCPKNG